MAIPDFQSVMRPLLETIADGGVHSNGELYAILADRFSLSDQEQRELLPSRRQELYKNRIAWATTHLAKAGLVERTGRGRVRITDRGRNALESGPDRVTVPYLAQFPEYAAFRGFKRSAEANGPQATLDDSASVSDRTPEEIFEASYLQLRNSLASELLDQVLHSPSDFFERLVVDLLVAMGYGGSHGDVVQAFGRSGDGGIDGIIKEDRLGLDFVYVQAKRWSSVVGRPLVQGFAGSLEGQRARKGVFITTSTFSKEARDYVTRIEKRIVLIDGDELANLMIDFGVGVADVTSYQIKRVDLDYFAEE